MPSRPTGHRQQACCSPDGSWIGRVHAGWAVLCSRVRIASSQQRESSMDAEGICPTIRGVRRIENRRRNKRPNPELYTEAGVLPSHRLGLASSDTDSNFSRAQISTQDYCGTVSCLVSHSVPCLTLTASAQDAQDGPCMTILSLGLSLGLSAAEDGLKMYDISSGVGGAVEQGDRVLVSPHKFVSRTAWRPPFASVDHHLNPAYMLANSTCLPVVSSSRLSR